MHNKVKASRKFEDKDKNGDVTWLLKEIRSVSHQLEASVSLYDSVDEAKRAYYLYKQEPEDLNSTHLKNYRTNVDVVKHFGSDLFSDEALLTYEKEKEKEKDNTNGKTGVSEEEYRDIVRDKLMAGGVFKKGGQRQIC